MREAYGFLARQVGAAQQALLCYDLVWCARVHALCQPHSASATCMSSSGSQPVYAEQAPFPDPFPRAPSTLGCCVATRECRCRPSSRKSCRSAGADRKLWACV